MKLHPPGTRVSVYTWTDARKRDTAYFAGTVCGSIRYNTMWYNIVLLDDGREIDVIQCSPLKEAA